MPPTEQRPKVFCIGFQKTGTTSLHAALTMLGYRTAAVVGRKLTADQLRIKGARLCIDTMRDFDAAEDMPWPVFFRELDCAYPGSKFILTVREPGRWFQSIENHFGDHTDEMQAFVYGRYTAAPKGNRSHYIDVLKTHEKTVLNYFASRPDDLLVMDLEAGDGWAALCTFLGVKIPPQTFPQKNRAADRQKLSYRMKKRVDLMMGRVPTPERLL
ncbi:MAG: sulfotransferase [Parvularculaceae bacterium]